MNESKTQVIQPDPDCKYCHGEGKVYDTVPYGSTTALLPSFCICVEEQTDDDTDEIILDTAPPEPHPSNILGEGDPGWDDFAF